MLYSQTQCSRIHLILSSPGFLERKKGDADARQKSLSTNFVVLNLNGKYHCELIGIFVSYIFF